MSSSLFWKAFDVIVIINCCSKLYFLCCHSDKSNAKTKCELEREKQARIAASIPDIFVPECSSVDGLYSQIQQSPWFAWCVNRYNGKMVNGTNRKHSLGLPVCAGKMGFPHLLPTTV